MKWLSIHSSLLSLTAVMVTINCQGYYVVGAGYQGDQSSKGIDNGDNSGSANYQFEYGVDDGAVGQQFGHEEERNGYLTRGRYSVLLPDGRLQVVTYQADQNGYRADVTYENGISATRNSGKGYNSPAAGRNVGTSGGYEYEKVETSASSYGSPVPPPQQSNNNKKGYDGFQGGNSMKSYGKGSSRSFVKLRRKVDGKMFNYAY